MYYLLCCRRTRTVVRKSHKPATLGEVDLVSLLVDKETWKSFRAGDLVTAFNLPTEAYKKWMNAIQ